MKGSGPVLGDTHAPRIHLLTQNLITAVITNCNVGHDFATLNNSQNIS